MSDGVIPTVFGVLLIDGHYDAYPGEVEFRGGKLVRIEFRYFHGAAAEGMTVGFTTFPDLDPASVSPTGEADGGGFFEALGVNHVYVRGALTTEIDLGWVNVRPRRAG